jgi:hypothetical protein
MADRQPFSQRFTDAGSVGTNPIKRMHTDKKPVYRNGRSFRAAKSVQSVT